MKLAKSPLCSVCYAAGRITKATDVDHLDPHNGPDDPRFWAWENLDAKCHSCHSRKTATADSSFARRGRNATPKADAQTALEGISVDIHNDPRVDG